MSTGKYLLTFRRDVLPTPAKPSSLYLSSCLALKMDARQSVVTSCTIHQSTRPQIPENLNLTASFSSVTIYLCRRVSTCINSSKPDDSVSYILYFICSLHVRIFYVTHKMNSDHCFVGQQCDKELLVFCTLHRNIII